MQRAEWTRTWYTLLLLLPLPPAKGQSAARVQESLKTSSHVPAARIRRHHSDAQHTLFFSQRATASAWLALLRSLSLPSSLSLLSRSFKMPRCALAASISLFLSLPLPSPPLPLSSLVPHPSLCLLPLFWLFCASWSLSFVSTKNQRGRGDAHPQIFVQQSAVWSRRYLKGLSSLTTAQRRLTARVKLGSLHECIVCMCMKKRSCTPGVFNEEEDEAFQSAAFPRQLINHMCVWHSLNQRVMGNLNADGHGAGARH